MMFMRRRRASPRLALVSVGFVVAGLAIGSAQSGPKRPRITGVAGFAAKVGDMVEAKTFYSTVLGLDEAFTIKNPVGGTDLTTYHDPQAGEGALLLAAHRRRQVKMER